MKDDLQLTIHHELNLQDKHIYKLQDTYSELKSYLEQMQSVLRQSMGGKLHTYHQNTVNYGREIDDRINGLRDAAHAISTNYGVIARHIGDALEDLEPQVTTENPNESN